MSDQVRVFTSTGRGVAIEIVGHIDESGQFQIAIVSGLPEDLKIFFQQESIGKHFKLCGYMEIFEHTPLKDETLKQNETIPLKKTVDKKKNNKLEAT